jgi:hypothetical protein
MISSLERDGELRSLMLLEGRRLRKHGRMVVLTRGFTQMVGVVDGLLRDMRDAGQLRPSLHLHAVRSALVGAFEGLLRDQLLAERADFPARYDAAELRAALAAALDGFLARELPA